jgi:hypothetical protein
MYNHRWGRHYFHNRCCRRSSSISVQNTVHIADNGHAILVEANPDPNLDFSATMFGMTTTCTPISRVCNLNVAFGVSTPYDCGASFPNIRGDMSTTVALVFNLTLVNTQGVWEPLGTGSNPFNAPVATTSSQWTAIESFCFGVRWTFFNVVYSVVVGEIHVITASELETYPFSGPLSIAGNAAGSLGLPSITDSLWLAAEFDVSGNSTEFACRTTSVWGFRRFSNPGTFS